MRGGRGRGGGEGEGEGGGEDLVGQNCLLKEEAISLVYRAFQKTAIPNTPINSNQDTLG